MSNNQRLFIAIAVFLAAFTYMRLSPKREVERISIGERAPIQETVEEVAMHASIPSLSDDSVLPEKTNKMAALLFSKEPPFPFMERVRYCSRVDWLTGRRAYIGDYASHYKTSKHFISASLHGKGNYFSEKVSQGDCFNVLKKDYPVEFHLGLDLSRCCLWLWAFDGKEEKSYLLNQYDVCVGALSQAYSSGCNTPCGLFSLGEEISVYKEGVEGLYKNHKLEMISVFGKRWIPLQDVIEGSVVSCRGLGIHGVPIVRNDEGELVEKVDCIGGYHSNGCIRLKGEDMEELFALIVSRPAFLHIAQDYTQLNIPGRT